MREKRRARRFRLGLLLYALLLILIGGAALMLLNRFLTVFEATRPAGALEAYRQTLLAEGSTPGCRAALTALDPALRSEDENVALAVEMLQEAELQELVSESTAEEKHYRVRYGEVTVGHVVLQPAEEEGFGLRGWELKEESFDFSPFFHDISVTVPPEYRVFLGEHELGRAELVERGIPYATLGESYSLVEGLPYLVRYTSGLYMGELPLRVLNAEGRELTEEQQTERVYLNTCGEETCEAIAEFVDRFLNAYVLFTANIDQNDEKYFEQILPMTAPGSSLRRRLQDGNQNTWWSWVRSCELLDTEIQFCTDLGEGRYLVDLHYTTRVVAYADPVTETYSIRILLNDTEGRLLADTLYNY